MVNISFTAASKRYYFGREITFAQVLRTDPYYRSRPRFGHIAELAVGGVGNRDEDFFTAPTGEMRLCGKQKDCRIDITKTLPAAVFSGPLG